MASGTGRRSRSRTELDAARVGVVHEYEILRRGLTSCLADDPQVEVVFAIATGAHPSEANVVVASPLALATGAFTCPVVVVCSDRILAPPQLDGVAAIIQWPVLTPQQLVASVRAVAAGFRLEFDAGKMDGDPLDPRWIEVLRLLAAGATTRTISERLFYSERTVKSLIHDLESELRAETRAQAVAEALRRGLI